MDDMVRLIIPALVLIVVGGFMATCTGQMIRFQVWLQHSLMGAQYVPSARTYTVMRIVGTFLAVLGLLIGIRALR